MLLTLILAGACSAVLEPVVPTVRPTSTPAPTTPGPPTEVPVSPTPILAAALANTATFGPSPNPFPTRRPPTPTQAVPLAARVRIEYFTSDIAVGRPGDTITLYWSIEGAPNAVIYRLDAEGQRARSWNVIRTGSLKVELRSEDGSAAQFVLVASPEVEQALTVRITGNPLVEPPAPGSPGAILGTTVVEQPFERGFMYWVATERRIYVLYNEANRWAFFADEYVDGQPESDPNITAPGGLLQPVRGFGLVWRTKSGVRDKLGWATAPEVAYDSQVQGDGAVEGGAYILRARDGRTLELSGGGATWRVVEPAQ